MEDKLLKLYRAVSKLCNKCRRNFYTIFLNSRVQIFSNFGHPTNVVLKGISKGILQWLRLDNDIDDVELESALEEYEDPIYTCVRKVLGLQYSKPYLRQYSNKKIRKNMDIDKYIKEYYYWYQ